MEIKRDMPPKRFTPVTIKLDSQEEVDLIFHLANCREDLPFENYAQNVAGSTANDGGLRLLDLKNRLFGLIKFFYYEGRE